MFGERHKQTMGGEGEGVGLAAKRRPLSAGEERRGEDGGGLFGVFFYRAH